MEITMLENGLDFIISAILHLQQAEEENCEYKEQNIKYSLLHLSSGIELILKSRLYKEHWTYIFSDMNRANKEHLVNGSFRSVESNIIIDRLKILCNIDINKDSKEAFENLRKLRNQMVHFTIKDTFPAIEACINKALEEINKFIAKNYSDFTSPVVINLKAEDEEFGLTEKEEELIEKLIKHTAKLKEHYDEAIEMAKAKAKDEAVLDELLECPSCKEKLLKLDYNNSSECHCFFCTYEEDGENAAEEYLSAIQRLSKYEIIKDGAEYPLYDCPQCARNSMLKIDENYICFSCAISYEKEEIGFCDECGGLIYLINDNSLALCASCTEYKTSY